MQIERGSDMEMGAGARGGSSIRANRTLSTHYKMEAFASDGTPKWVEEFDNLVVNAGLDDSLDKHLKGAAYTAAWYVGLTDGTPTPAAADDQAAHAGWVEVVAYDEAVRQTLTLGAVAGQSVDNVGNEATFTISANNTVVGGAFISTTDTRGGTVDTLYGVGAFTAADKTLDDDDTIAITVTCTAAAA